MREVRIRLNAADVSRLRWAISPSWELLASLRVLARPGGHAIHMPWLSRHRNDPLLMDPTHRAVRDLAVDIPAHLPGFLAPTPESPLVNIDDELALVAGTPAPVVRREVRAVWPGGAPPSLARLTRAPRTELRAIVTSLRAYWTRTIEPSWPLMRGVLERDIHHRATDLAERGPGQMLNDIHPDISWHPESQLLVLTNRLADVPEPDRTLVGRGLVLVPSVFAWPRAYAKTEGPWTPVVRYPARGVGALWEPSQPSHDVSAVMGVTTTHQLARITGRAPGGVSVHLHRLVAAGLVSKARVGREIYYARTARGDTIVA